MSTSTTLSPLVPNTTFAQLATPERVATVAAALTERGFLVQQAETAADAKAAVLAYLAQFPAGQTVYDTSSTTVKQLGLEQADLTATGLVSQREQIDALDYATQGDARRRLMAAPDVTIGSVHAITEAGQVLIGSASGSQIAPYVFGSGAVLWIVGAQKLVSDLNEAYTRVQEYTVPLEDERMRQTYGSPTTWAKTLIVEREVIPNRVTVLIVNENLGF